MLALPSHLTRSAEHHTQTWTWPAWPDTLLLLSGLCHNILLLYKIIWVTGMAMTLKVLPGWYIQQNDGLA